MPKRSSTIHKEFLTKMRTLNSIRLNFERAFVASLLRDEDIIQAYAGLYLDLFTEFENLIEKLFIGIADGSIKHDNAVVRKRIIIKPITEIESILFGNKSYMDWLPYKDYTLPRAKTYLIDGKPFTLLTDVQKQQITNYHKIRNAIAHKSKKASNDFNNIVAGLTLLPIEKTPIGYLRSVPNIAIGKTQFEIISDELKTISHTLCQ